ncbi:hypothetical protein PV721_26500, partial [Streptomyces sp. MB09-01]|nr:hypothetical protein [Streptomyces sp. MB09-01]
MKLTRAALLLATGALAPALLLSTPSFAATPAAGPAATAAVVVVGSDTENAAAIAKILADPASGKAVIREANEALSGTPEDRVA